MISSASLLIRHSESDSIFSNQQTEVRYLAISIDSGTCVPRDIEQFINHQPVLISPLYML